MAIVILPIILFSHIPAMGEGKPLQLAANQLSKEIMEQLPEDAKRVLREHPELLEKTPEKVKKIKAVTPLEEGDKKEMEALEPEEFFKKYDWQKSIYVKNLFSPRLKQKERDDLVHFGHSIFDRAKGKFSPLSTLPISPDYIVGPGDEILITLWGRMEGRYPTTIDREGKIYIPKFGTLYVAGKTYSELKEFIKERVSVVTGASADVTVTGLKGIKIFILGEVSAPGAYNVSSFHSAMQALYTAGGIKDTGSFRDIRVLRKGKLARRIDLYQMLLQGNTSKDIQLLQGDSVFVPVVSRLVAISGEVRRQAIFELSKKEGLKALIKMAGGFSPTAYKKRVQIERLEKNLSMIVLDVDADVLEASPGDFPLEDGDIVRVMPLFLEDTNVVTLKGNVYAPGKYELKDNMRVRDLLPGELSFLPDTYFDYATIIRLIPPDMHREIIPLNLRKAILEKDESTNVPLKPFDKVLVYSRKDFKDLPLATITGMVRNPGPYEVKEGMRVSDLIMLGGGVKRGAYLEKGEIVRIKKDRTLETIYFDVTGALGKKAGNDPLIKDEDNVIIRSHPNSRETVFVRMEGELTFPGVYAARRGEKLSSLIERAGGFTKDAYLKGAQFTRESVRKIQQERIDKLIEDLEHKIAMQTSEELVGILDPEDIKVQTALLSARRSLLTKLKTVQARGRIVIKLAGLDTFQESASNLILEDGDRLYIPQFMNVVNIIGEVYNPTSVTYNPEEKKAGHYLEMVGGPTENAAEKEIFIIKSDGTVLSRHNVGNIRNAKLEPGDTIAVPEKIVKTRALKDIKDITQIIFQIAVTTGILIAAF